MILDRIGCKYSEFKQKYKILFVVRLRKEKNFERAGYNKCEGEKLWLYRKTA